MFAKIKQTWVYHNISGEWNEIKIAPESEYLLNGAGWAMAPRLSTMRGRAAAHAEDISADVTLAASNRKPENIAYPCQLYCHTFLIKT